VPLRVVPEDIILTCVSVFRRKERRNDPAASIAMGRFISSIEGDKLKPEEARILLADEKEISAHIEKVRQTIFKKKDLRNLVETIYKNTDPIAARKSGFRINIKAGIIFFLAGLFASPLFSIVFKKPLETIDRLINGKAKMKSEKARPAPEPPLQDQDIPVENTKLKNPAAPLNSHSNASAPLEFRRHATIHTAASKRISAYPKAVQKTSRPYGIHLICLRPTIPVIRSRLIADQRPH
jgi:hypothetical protein